MNAKHRPDGMRPAMAASVAVGIAWLGAGPAGAAGLWAGAARADITDEGAGPIHDRLQVKALVVKDDRTAAALITVDAVAIGEIGPIGNDYLPQVRSRLEKEFGIRPGCVLVNASHCHGKVGRDVGERTVRAVGDAWRGLVPVDVGCGTGREDRIMENRRLRLKDGREADVRHAYSLPPDEDVAGVGPVDPEIGILRLDRKDGRPLAVVYNFACHPIQGVPDGGITADIAGFAGKAIEDGLGEGTIALFLQGCGGDVNPIWYKDVDHPRDAEPLGTLLGLSTLAAARKVRCREEAGLAVIGETVDLPRADWAGRIAALESEESKLVASLPGTSLDLKTFLRLAAKYGLTGEYPSGPSHRYLHDRATGREDLDRLDAENRRNMALYVKNIHVMEELTRLQTNLALLKKHQADNRAAPRKTIAVEVLGMRIGDFVLVTFPGELTVQTGLDLKKRSPHPRTFVAACSNGYIYYAPTARQLANPGCAQEDCDCLLAPEWQMIYEDRAEQILKRL